MNYKYFYTTIMLNFSLKKCDNGDLVPLMVSRRPTSHLLPRLITVRNTRSLGFIFCLAPLHVSHCLAAFLFDLLLKKIYHFYYVEIRFLKMLHLSLVASFKMFLPIVTFAISLKGSRNRRIITTYQDSAS